MCIFTIVARTTASVVVPVRITGATVVPALRLRSPPHTGTPRAHRFLALPEALPELFAPRRAYHETRIDHGDEHPQPFYRHFMCVK